MIYIYIDYDSYSVQQGYVVSVSKAIQDIVAEIINSQEVCVLTNDPKITVNIPPIIITIQINPNTIETIDTLFGDIESKMKERKCNNNFPYTITMHLIPLQGQLESKI